MSEHAQVPEFQPQPSDAVLLAAARTDPDAFCEVYERHYAAIRAWFQARVRNDALALDLTAETFAQALRGLHRFRDEADGSAAPWLYGIARHLWLKYERRLRVETSAREKLGMPLRDDALEDLERVDDRIDVEDTAAAVRMAFGQLRPGEREALELRVVQGLSYAEVARELGSSEPAARKRVMRALRALRNRLEGVWT